MGIKILIIYIVLLSIEAVATLISVVFAIRCIAEFIGYRFGRNEGCSYEIKIKEPTTDPKRKPCSK